MFSSMTLLVYSIFIEQPVSGRTQPAGQNGTAGRHRPVQNDALTHCQHARRRARLRVHGVHIAVDQRHVVYFRHGGISCRRRRGQLGSWATAEPAVGQRRSYFSRPWLKASGPGSVRGLCGARAAVQVEGPPAIGEMGAGMGGELTSTAVSQL